MLNVQVRIRRVPPGLPTPEDFEVLESPAPPLTAGTFLCRTRWLAIDPTVAAATGPGSAGTPPRPGEVVPSLAVCDVLESRHDVFTTGSHVVVDSGLQKLFVSDGTGVRSLHTGQTPASSALGVLGPPGLAAYFGLLDLAAMRPGETVLVSAASDAAGSMAGQIAALMGARAIGIAGSKEKCDWVTRHARFAACINRRTQDVGARLKQLAPRGVDIFFDSTGGELLQTVLGGQHLAQGGRVILNTISGRDASLDSAAMNLAFAQLPGARLLQLNFADYRRRREQFLKDAIAWFGAGRIAYKDDIVDGLERAPGQLCKTRRGENFGRPLIRMSAS